MLGFWQKLKKTKDLKVNKYALFKGLRYLKRELIVSTSKTSSLSL